jgi:hypothetical protein
MPGVKIVTELEPIKMYYKAEVREVEGLLLLLLIPDDWPMLLQHISMAEAVCCCRCYCAACNLHS